MKSLFESVMWKTSGVYRIRKGGLDLVLEGDYVRLQELLLKEWRLLTDEPLSNHVRSHRFGRKRRAFLIARDFFQQFGSFSEALAARVRYQEFVSKGFIGLLPWLARERVQVALENQVVPGRNGMSHSFGCAATKSFDSSKPPWFVKRSRFQSVDDRQSNNRFDRAIFGKTVLVVGPSPTSTITQEVIDQFDVLAIPKLHKGVWLAEGLKASDEHLIVTYLNHKTIARVIRENFLDTSGWHIARVKSSEDVGLLRSMIASYDIEGKDVGVMTSPGKLMMNDYGPFMGPAMIFDLLCSRPESLHVSGFTFYVDSDGQDYHTTYDSSNHTDSVLVEALRQHGAFSNFLFVKSLWQFGLITVEKDVERALSLSATDYAQYLDKKFGVKPWLETSAPDAR